MSSSSFTTVCLPTALPAAGYTPLHAKWLHLQVKSCLMQGEGIYAGDMLKVDQAAEIATGQLLVLSFDGRMILRRLEIGQHCVYLHPLHRLTQMIEWPFHEPLPLIGVVRQIIRRV